jgi:hypothetical protein
VHSNQLIINFWVGVGPFFCWAGAGPFSFVGPMLAHSNKETLVIFSCFLFYPFWLISIYILCRRNINPVLKYLVFVKTSKNTKKIEKKKKNIFVHTAKCLKAKKKSILCFSYTKKQCFSMYFGFNNQFIEVKRTLAKISKTTKNLFCFVLVLGIMNLYDFLERVDDRCDDVHVRQSIFPGLKILSSL